MSTSSDATSAQRDPVEASDNADVVASEGCGDHGGQQAPDTSHESASGAASTPPGQSSSTWSSTLWYAAGVAGCAVGGALLAQAIAVPVLGLLGFGAKGIVGGSTAAALQRGGAVVVRGSWFALAQRAGAIGAVSGPLAKAVGSAGAAIGAASCAAGVGLQRYRRGRKSKMSGKKA